MFKFFDQPVVVLLTEKMLKLCKHILVFSWIEFGFICVFQNLDLEEKLQEIVVCWSWIDVDWENGFQSFVTLSVFAHCTIMNRVSFIAVLLSENFSHSFYDVFCVLFEQIEYSNVEVLVSLERICIMEDTAG